LLKSLVYYNLKNMNKSFFFVWLIMLISQLTNAQTYTMGSAPAGNGSTINSPCGATLLDPGGAGNYGSGANVSVTFCAPAGEYLVFNFSMFNTEQGFDFLRFFNGPTIASPLIVSLSGTNLPSPVYSSLGGCITVQFTSDGSITEAGFQALISCSTQGPPVMPSCVGNPPAGNTCATATPICDLDGYCGNTSTSTYTSNSWGSAGAPFGCGFLGLSPCPGTGLTGAFCGSLENNSFLSYVASSSTISFNVWVFNSQFGDGIQIMVFSATGCTGDVTNHYCNGQMLPTGTTNFHTVTVSGLTPGNTYYIMIDGFAGDVCDYVIGAGSGISVPVQVDPETITICPGETVPLSASGGNGTYNWNATPQLNTTSGANVIATPPAVPGTYTYTVNSATGNPLCPSATTAIATIIVDNCGCIVNATNSGNSCTGGTVNLFASNVPSATYSWSGPGGYSSTDQNPTGIVLPIAPGTYDYTVTANDGITSCTSTTTVEVYALPNVSAGTNQSVCNGAEVTLSGSGASTYTWTGGVTNGVSFTPPLGVNNYTVSGTDVNGCVNTAAVSVTVNAPPIVSAGTYSAVCVDASAVSLTGSPLGGVFSGTGVTGNSFDPSVGTQTISYNYTDGNDCSGSAATTITVNPIPTASISGGASYCPGDPVTNVTASVTGTGPWTVNYTLDGVAQTENGSTSPISLGNTPGVYVLTGVQDALCSNTVSGTQTITILSNPVITLTPTDPATCNGSDGSILVSGTGTGDVIWSGTSSGNANGVSLNYTISSLAAGDYDVYFVDGTTGCESAVETTSLLNASGPTLTVNNPAAVCSPATIDLTASASTDIGTISYYTDPTYTTLVSDPTAVGTGTYYVVADNAGCTDEGTITVVVNPIPVADPSTTTPVLCAGETVVLNATSVTGGTYSWSGPNSFVSTTQDPQITNATTAASGTYTLTVTANGCTSAPATVDVLVNPIPVATAGTTTPSVCLGADIALTGNATSGTYSWSGPNGFSSTDQNPVVSPSTLNNSGTYTLTITADGCVSLPSNVSVTVNPLPVIDGGEDVTVCEGTTIVLSGSGGVSYVWTSDVVNGAPFTPALGSIVYTVTGTDANGCVGTDNVTVNVVPVPNADLSADVTYGVPPLTVTFTNSSTDATSYAWNLGNGNTFNTTATGTEEETYGTEGVYTIVLTASNGICSDLATVVVTVESPAPIIHVPNVFSPNGDGSNDVFFIDNMYLSTLNVKIFNRWGNLMHEITDPAGTWDGTTPDGKEASDGVYFFSYVAVGINQTELSGHGNVTLVR
jgi:gliding motility-associated-like protein